MPKYHAKQFLGGYVTLDCLLESLLRNLESKNSESTLRFSQCPMNMLFGQKISCPGFTSATNLSLTLLVLMGNYLSEEELV